MTERQRRALTWVVFAVLLLASAYLRERQLGAIDHAIVWLPTGVAIAGAWLLGNRSCWIVGIVTIVQRLVIGYRFDVAIPAAFGSSAEALLGAYVLRRLDFRAEIDRLRDVLAVAAAALTAPLASMALAWIARLWFWDHRMPFYSGWSGWWWMNALGALAIVPLAATWIGRGRPDPRATAMAAGAAAILALLVAGLMFVVPEGALGIIYLDLLLPLSLMAALRYGPRGAATVGAVGAFVVAHVTSFGFGPFLGMGVPERTDALQIFDLTLLTIPLIFGALIAEGAAARRRGELTEELSRSIQAALPDITYRVRRDGVCVDMIVPEGAEILIPPEKIIGHSFAEVLPPEVMTGLRSKLRCVLEERRTATVEYAVTIGGRRLNREARCVPYGDDEILAVVRDITDRKVAEELTAFETGVLELIATGRPSSDVLGAVVRGIERLTGDGLCSVILLDGSRMHVAHAPSFPPEYNAAIEGKEIGPDVGSCGAAAFTGRSVVVEEIETHPLWAKYKQYALAAGLRACWSVPIRESEGIVLGTFAVYYRSTRAPAARELQLVERAAALVGIVIERERRIEQLRHSEDLLASINRNVGEGLFRTTPTGEFIYANRGLAQMFGFATPEELMPIRSTDLYASVERRDAIKEALDRNGSAMNEEVLFRRRDGTRFWGLVSTTTVRDARGEVAYYDGVISDISGLKELEGQLRQSQKMEAVGKLAGGIAHDFNNLLTAISGYTEAIRDAVEPGGTLHAHAEEVLKASSRAAGLTRQLLAYSRQQVLAPQVLDLSVVVEQLGGMLRRLIGEHITLVTNPMPSDCWVRVDRGQIEQVLVNLVVNARDAMPDGGELRVTSLPVRLEGRAARAHDDLPPGDYVELSVTDSGAGMAQDVLARAFDPFFTTKGPGKGTGLGLSTVYGIVKQSGGSVWLESEFGRGTTARILLPKVAPAVDEPPAPPPPASPSAEAMILVVEDEEIVRTLVRATLVRAGYTVLEAPDGDAALALSREHAGPIDVLVTDIVMPRMGGRELATRLLAERPGLGLVFMSGYPNEAREMQEFAGGSGEFLQKPFGPSVLVEKVRALIARRVPRTLSQ